MNLEIKSIHFDLPEDFRELIEKKMQKIGFAEDMLVSLSCTVSKGKDYSLEADIHFRWGTIHHITVNDFDLREGIDKLSDKIDAKVAKEKGKIKDHSNKDHSKTKTTQNE
ncbi:MAG: HPF/RaiA family ribosome-associated protein [Spirochaetales bacterium]|jgi:putative sigma-54 modulation protein|nr:HPF/RaiA family ribosome-associated protein [Spirochaetales bacterium]